MTRAAGLPGPRRRPGSQSAFVRGFIDDRSQRLQLAEDGKSQSAFVRGFIDDATSSDAVRGGFWPSQSAFVRGFIDDL